MASCIAVSAEISATVISTRANNNMRKNCRIASDYIFYRKRKSLRRSAIQLWRDLATVLPLVAAGMAGPTLFVGWNGNASICCYVRDRFIQFFKADIKRLASRTLRLFEGAYAFKIQHFWDRLVQNFVGGCSVLRMTFQFNSAEEIGDEPIHTDHIVVHEIGLNSRGFETAFGQ